MTSINWRKLLAPMFLSLFLFTTACTPSAPSRYDKVQKDTTGMFNKTAVARKAEKGGKFNQFFPTETRNYKVVPTQEKKGFAEYKLVKDGKTVAMLSVSDTTSLPSAAAKFKDSDFKISGFPAVDQGANATAVLVNDRYQVKVLTRDTSFGKEDRVDWLQKFDLRGLAKLPAAAVAKKAQPAPALKPATQPALTAKPQPAQVTAEPAKAAPRQGFFARRQAKPEPVKAVQNAADQTVRTVEKTADKVSNTVQQTAKKVEATATEVKDAVKQAADDITSTARPEKAKPKFSFFSRKPAAQSAPAKALQNTTSATGRTVGNAIDAAVDKVSDALNLTSKGLDDAVNDLKQAVDQAARNTTASARSAAILTGSM
jgi:gas vesicle protein